MKTRFDRKGDAAYVEFSSADSARQIALDDARIIDYAADGSVVGVEFISPSRGVAAGVEATDADVVLIHDGARPLAPSALVDAVAAATLQSGCAVPLVPLAESLRRLRRTSIVDWIDRYGLHTAQTPQGVLRNLLLEAYAQHDPWGSEAIIDETLLVQMGGVTVTAVRGERGEPEGDRG